ncbi:MAG TPA: efflux RND transporter periplasmic adaptor subunit [Rhodanobacter sp.]|nr:efflux RND transporter periplasmic adaptor subunit [Rhodanobacter sp.]
MKPSFLRASALGAGLLVLAACGSHGANPAQMPPPAVGTITVQPQNEPLTKDLVGRLSAYRSADVRARVAGLVLKRSYVEGSDVKKGQLLFEIDPATYQAALNASLANLAAAKATYANAHVIAQRDRQLVTKGYVSRAQLDTDEATERSAAAAVQQAQSSVAAARINLGYTKVTSPIDGRAGQQRVTEGAIVGNGTSDAGANATLLTTVDQIDPLYVNFTMSVADMEQLRQAQQKGGVTLAQPDQASVQVTLPDGSVYPQPGTMDFTSATVDPATGSVNLRALLPNPKHTLLPGMYVTLKARLGEQHRVFVVPQQAVLRDTVGPYVYVAGKDGNAKRHDVTTQSMHDGNWIVNGGLAAGDQVIVSGVQDVHDDEPVKASAWKPEPAANGTKAAGK